MPTLANIDLDTLRPPGNPDDFVVLERPMFKEHWTRESRNEDGSVKCKPKLLGRNELERIATRCNVRIADTGDFAPIVINHTKDDGSIDPELIGFSGPYHVGTFGNLQPKATIYGKMWVFKDKKEKLRQYPRLSVEYWCSEDDPGDGYFDPVSLLGATTPELDLGVHYSKIDGSNRRLMRYAKVERFQAMPGGSNTFVPGMVGDDDSDKSDADSPQQYEKDSTSMATTLTPADLQQIVAAMTPIVTQQINEAMACMKGEMGSQGGDGLGEDLDGDGLDDADGLDLDGDSDLDVGDDLDGMDDSDDGDADDLDGMDEDNDGTDLAGEGDEPDADDAPEIDSEMPDMGDDESTDDGDVAGGDDDDSDSDLESSGQDEGKAKMSADKKPDEKPKKYSRQPVPGMTVQQYAKENAELRERYEKSITENRAIKDEFTALKARIDTIESEKKTAVRYAKLNGLQSQGFSIDVDEELKDAESMSDEQFARHCTKIVERYARVPMGRALPIPGNEKIDGVPRDEKRERYSKQATDVTLELRSKGKQVEFSDVLENITRNDGKYVPA